MKHIILCMTLIGLTQVNAGDKSPRRGANANAAAASRPSLPGHTSLNASANAASSSAAGDMKSRAAMTAKKSPLTPIPTIPSELIVMVDMVQPEQAIEYLKKHPELISSQNGENSLLDFAIRESGRSRPPRGITSAARGTTGAEEVEYPNPRLVRYIISQRPLVDANQSLTCLRMMVGEYFRRYFISPENADIIPAMVDLALDRGTSSDDIDEILEPALKDVETNISISKRNIRIIRHRNKPQENDLLERTRSSLANQEAQRDILTNALNRFAKRTIAEAEGSLAYRANFPRELRGLTGEYLLRGKKNIPPAAYEGEDSEEEDIGDDEAPEEDDGK